MKLENKINCLSVISLWDSRESLRRGTFLTGGGLRTDLADQVRVLSASEVLSLRVAADR